MIVFVNLYVQIDEKKNRLSRLFYLVNLYLDMVYRVALNGCKNTYDADDMVQDTFMKLLKRTGTKTYLQRRFFTGSCLRETERKGDEHG